MSEARSWSDTPLCQVGHGGSLHSRGEEEVTSYKGIDVRWAH